MESIPDTAATREDILAAALKAKANPNMTVVPAPELGPGRTILVRQLDGPSGEALERSHFEKDESGVFRYQTAGQVVRWVLACACDAQGNRLFAPSDQATVSDLPFSLLDRIFTEAKKLNEPDLEVVAKNS
jgi:hypothetical protein